MDAKELKALLETAVNQVKEQSEKNNALEAQVKSLDTKLTEALDNGSEDQIKELQSEISDLRSKMKAPAAAITDDQAKKELQTITVKAFNQYARQVKTGHIELGEFMNSVGDQFKTLNISTPAEGGAAVAQVLSMDLIEYAREFSPILSMIGMKSGLTRDFRELVLVSYPSVGDGIENVAGVTLAATQEQNYAEVKADTVKVYANPRLTDEALRGTDYNVYADLVRLIGQEITIMLAYKVYYGDNTGKNGRGMLSSSRVAIGAAGESFKPAPTRDPDYFPAKPTGVSGSLGADSEAIINFFIDVKNSLPTAHLNGARWCMNRNTLGVVEKVKDADGNPLLIASYMDGGAARILGYPVDIDDTLPDIAADSTPIIFGNLSRAFAMSNGDIDYMLPNPYKISGVTIYEYHKEIFTIMQASDAIILVACTTNS